MGDKYITEEGKEQLLRLGFLNDNNSNNFNFLALGVTGSTGSTQGTSGFREADGYNYERAILVEEKNEDSTGSSLSISATFGDDNFNRSEGSTVTEIGIVNQKDPSNNDKWFAFMSVPNIVKNSNISLKYTIVISIE